MRGNLTSEAEPVRDDVARAASRPKGAPAAPGGPLRVLQRSTGNRATALLLQRRKGKGRFVQAARSPGAAAVTNPFVTSHMGNERDARNIALGRGLPVSHTIDIRSLGALLSEMRVRQQEGYHVGENRVNNPNGNPNQFLTANEYNIWETYTDNKGRLKPTRLIRRRFYYDAPTGHGSACHHFDGIA